MKKQIAIVGLGLIGGSLAMALRGFEDYEIVGVDRDGATLDFARAHAAADRVTEDAGAAIRTADVVVLCLHPRGIVDFLSAHRDHFKAGALVSGGRPGPPPGGGLHRLPPHGREGDLRHLPR